ncbi:MAG: uracil-DNA glycosylase [Burkholderiaceae bacterium]
MRWSERQVAMLREMGVRVWAPPDVPMASVELAEEPAAAAVAPPQLRPPARGLAPSTVPLPAAASAALPVLGGALPPGIATMDWAELRATVAACTACTLCESRTQTVFGVGHERADWMIVGEAPGEQEDRQGEPFVGKSGQLLDNMLRAIALTRGEADPARQVYIANTLKCRPPGNRNPAPAELVACEGFLIRQVQLVRPKIILAMGRFAVQSLLRSTEPIGRLRGRVHQYHGVPLIVTYHPAYLLRNLEDKAKAWDDLCLAVETARGAKPG